MPGMDGIEVCQRIRAQSSGPYVYILLLTSKKEKTDIVRGMAAGADDYVSKPFDPQELQMRLKAGKRIIDLQSRLLEAQRELQHMATHDNLTRLANRFSIINTLDRELMRACRDGTSLGIILADIDHFKKINDHYGHLAGDVVLREIAHRLRASVRAYDSVGRYGGEEFLIVLPACDRSAAYRTAERLRNAVSSTPVSIPEGRLEVTISLGVSTNAVGEAACLETVVRAADEALYQAKAAGRNCAVLAALPGGEETPSPERQPQSSEGPVPA
jgi:diguanylate cyclase (GGDEF)-like protein